MDIEGDPWHAISENTDCVLPDLILIPYYYHSTIYYNANDSDSNSNS